MNPFISFSDTLISGSIFNQVPELLDITTVHTIVSNKNLIKTDEKTPTITKILRNVDLAKLENTFKNRKKQNSNQQLQNKNPIDQKYKKKSTTYNCNFCEYICKTKSAFNYHYNNKHLKIDRFRCPHCKFSANLRTSVEDHLTINHQIDRKQAIISVVMNDLYKTYDDKNVK